MFGMEELVKSEVDKKTCQQDMAEFANQCKDVLNKRSRKALDKIGSFTLIPQLLFDIREAGFKSQASMLSNIVFLLVLQNPEIEEDQVIKYLEDKILKNK